MTRLTLAALALLPTVSAACAFPIAWMPSDWPQPGSFDGPGIVTKDEQGR